MVQCPQWINGQDGSMSRRPKNHCPSEPDPTLDGLIDHEEQLSLLNKSSACLKKINSSQFARFSKRERAVTAKFGPYSHNVSRMGSNQANFLLRSGLSRAAVRELCKALHGACMSTEVLRIKSDNPGSYLFAIRQQCASSNQIDPP
jgi:hypothetical protein